MKKIFLSKKNLGISIDNNEHVYKICKVLEESGFRNQYSAPFYCGSIVVYGANRENRTPIYDCYYFSDLSCDELVTSTYFLKNVNKTILFDGITK